MTNEKIKRYSFIVIILATLSVTMQIAANLVSARTIDFMPWSQNWGIAPLGVFFFPCCYIISDIISDVYGYRVSRWTAWLSLLLQIFLTGIINLILLTKPAGGYFVEEVFDPALKTVFSVTPWILTGGIFGSVLGGWVNDIVFQMFRHKDGEGKFIKRKLLSSAAAEIVDTVVFITIAFKIGMRYPWFTTITADNITVGVLQMYPIQFILKYAVEFITSPVAKFCSSKLRTIEGSEVFEDRNKFNIFGWAKKVKA